MANIVRRNEPAGEAPALWDPFRAMRDLLSWDPFAEMVPTLGRTQELAFTPRFDVTETDHSYVFKADLPGIEDKDLEITFTGNRLTVSGKREAEQRHEGETVFTYERSYGAFSRSFTLPEGVDADHAEADLRNGVLTVSIPKKPEHQPRKITIKGLAEKVKGVLGGKEKGSA